MDPIKEAFSRIKEDIASLKAELGVLRDEIASLKSSANQADHPFQMNQQTVKQTDNQTISSNNLPLEGPYSQNNGVSIGNRGVPTDRQIDQQMNKQTNNLPIFADNKPISEFRKANEILSQLDDVKREIRKKFKSLTAQEMKVFATVYMLENEGYDEITYKRVSSMLGLSESSIRDYVNKILQKGVIIDKIRHNNKTIYLKISSNIRNIASLETIQRLRDI